MEGTYAVYRMEKNRFLRDCVAVVSRPTAEEADADSLRSDYVFAIIKSTQDLSSIHVPEDLRDDEIFNPDDTILLRVGSECLLGMFGDGHCNCESERVSALREIERVGQGIYVHLPQEAQGQGLFYKAQELHLQVAGYAPSGEKVGPLGLENAYKYLLGSDAKLDRRRYTALARLFRDLRLTRYKYDLITESPAKLAALAGDLGVGVVARHSLKSLVTVENAGEYLSKIYKDYTLTDTELEEIYDVVFRAGEMPVRLIELLDHMRHDLAHGKEFSANRELLDKIARIPEERGLRFQSPDLDMLKDAASYEEYQVELEVTESDIRSLLDAKVLGGLDSLRYEENHFFDLAYLRHVLSRYMKVRYAYKVTDRSQPIECKFIHKIPVDGRDNTYRIKARLADNDDETRLLITALQDREQHLQPAFTHNAISPDPVVTVLIKRYSKTLRTLSLMGPEVRVHDLLNVIEKHINVKVIPDPSNYRFVRRELSREFEFEILKAQELALFRTYCVG